MNKQLYDIIYICVFNFQKRSMLLILIACIFMSIFIVEAKSHIVSLKLSNVDANSLNVMPGDTIYLESGSRNRLKISNVKGDSLHPVLITNKGGDVIVENNDFYFGILLSNCSFFRFTGSVNNTMNYGIKVLKTGPGASGLSVSEQSSNYEIDHIEISNCGFAGIFAFTQPTCNLQSNRGNFVQRNTLIRDNYIHDTFGEGMYIGHTFYTGYKQKCDGVDVELYPHEIKGLKVFNNKVYNSGYDGIQVGSAVENTEIYNNTIVNYGTANVEMQHSGIQIGAGTKLKCYNNVIIGGSGTGIVMMGVGGSIIFNNLIINAGLHFFPNDIDLRIYGIFVDDRFVVPNTTINILNNTIVNTKSDGIRYYSLATVKNLIANNLIVNPGSNYIYQPETTSYINLRSGVDVILMNNYFAKLSQLDLTSDSLALIKQQFVDLSIATRGYDVREYGVITDIQNKPRHTTPSIGVFEYDPIPGQFKVNGHEIELIHNIYTGIISIENKSQNSMRGVSIFNINGRTMFHVKVNELHFIKVNIKSVLQNGIYLLRVDRFRENFTYKFIVDNH